MQRGLTGHYVPSIAGGISCQAFVPLALPPSPALMIDSKLQKRINEANRALGRLDAISMLLPDTNLFLYSYVKVLFLGVQRINEGYPIAYRLLTEMHQALMTSGRGISRGPGEFRENQVWLGGHRADEAAFVPPPRHILRDCWSDLEKFINDQP